MSSLVPIKFENNTLYLIDQRRLPYEEVFLSYTDLQGVYTAIKDMVVRGAPCIGLAAIFGMALWVRKRSRLELSDLNQAASYLKSARPTAVNLAFEIDNVVTKIKDTHAPAEAYSLIVNYALRELEISEIKNRSMAKFVAEDLFKRVNKSKLNILTHCNTGHLACGRFGTALGVIQHLSEVNRLNMVFVDETRPYLQGSRLTAYELQKLNISHKIVVEGAASYLMSNALVDAICVGADRIVANGDTANKVGTANLAIIAKRYSIPFYVVAPMSSFDLKVETGKSIEIEMRDQMEILNCGEERIAPLSSEALNPSFDVTPEDCITGISCENGLILPPFQKGISTLFKEETL